MDRSHLLHSEFRVDVRENGGEPTHGRPESLSVSPYSVPDNHHSYGGFAARKKDRELKATKDGQRCHATGKQRGSVLPDFAQAQRIITNSTAASYQHYLPQRRPPLYKHILHTNCPLKNNGPKEGALGRFLLSGRAIGAHAAVPSPSPLP